LIENIKNASYHIICIWMLKGGRHQIPKKLLGYHPIIWRYGRPL